MSFSEWIKNINNSNNSIMITNIESSGYRVIDSTENGVYCVCAGDNEIIFINKSNFSPGDFERLRRDSFFSYTEYYVDGFQEGKRVKCKEFFV